MSFDDSSPGELARRLERFVDNLPGLAYRCEPEPPWEMSFIRGRVEALTGNPPSAFEDSEVAYGELVVEEDVDELVATVEAGVEAREQFTASYRIRTHDGGITHVFERGVPVVEDGAVTALEGIIVDVTERHEREAALREEQAFTRSILAALPDILYDFDETGSLTRWNDRLTTVTGYDDAEIAEMDTLAFVAEADRDRVARQIGRVLEDGESTTVEARLQTKDARHVPH